MCCMYATYSDYNRCVGIAYTYMLYPGSNDLYCDFSYHTTPRMHVILNVESILLSKRNYLLVVLLLSYYCMSKIEKDAMCVKILPLIVAC